MKVLFIPVSIITLVLVLSGIWIYQAGAPKDTSLFFYSEIIHVGIIALFFFLGVVFSIRRVRAREGGFPEEDELSKKIIQKASTVSFFISLFIWLIVLFLNVKTMIDVEVLFSYGFIGTALVFMINWIVFNRRGLGDE